MSEPSRLRILYAVNSDWFFLSHRLPIASAAAANGAEVFVACIDTGRGEEIKAHGFRFIPVPMTHSGINPLKELRTLAALVKIYRSVCPDIVHHLTIKPIIYGSIAARLARVPATVNAVTGLGFVYSESTRARLLRPLVELLYRTAMRGARTYAILQNPDDQRTLLEAGIVKTGQTVLIKGSGVDCGRFKPTSKSVDDPLVVLPSRMIWDKGVGEFVAAAESIRSRNPQVRFALIGEPDQGNPKAVSEKQLYRWAARGNVEWWGYQEDMPAILNRSTIVVLPSKYPEGVPKILIEAAACGRPIVTTDTPGCREIVRHGLNGLLVPAGDVAALVTAIERLLGDEHLRDRLGRRGRAIAKGEFAVENVVNSTIRLYHEVITASGIQATGLN